MFSGFICVTLVLVLGKCPPQWKGVVVGTTTRSRLRIQGECPVSKIHLHASWDVVNMLTGDDVNRRLSRLKKKQKPWGIGNRDRGRKICQWQLAGKQIRSPVQGSNNNHCTHIHSQTLHPRWQQHTHSHRICLQTSHEGWGINSDKHEADFLP